MTGAQPEDWRRKYYDSIRAIEREEQRFRDLEQVLRRLVGRLCVAAQGQSPRLDEELRRLADAVRNNADAQTLDELSPRLISAVNETDHLVATQSLARPAGLVSSLPGGSFDPEAVRDALAGMLQELRRDEELAAAAAEVEQRLAQELTPEQLPSLLSGIAGLAATRVHNIESRRQDVEGLLGQMLERLNDMTGFVAGQDADQTQQMENSATLTVQVASEVRAIGASMDSGDDLAMVRAQLRVRLDSIGRHLQEYRERETVRVQSIRERNEHMRARVEQLENEARLLHNQLRDEQRLSLLDSLTGVPNRHAFEARFDEELKRFRRFGQPTCIALWDIDRFKLVNDSYGHRAGDKVLKIVAEALAGGIRTTDFLARYGGEEFVLVMPGTRLEDALRVTESLRGSLALLGFHFRGLPVSVTASCGITQLREGDTSVDAFDRADKALYAAKDAGRNRCVGA